MVSYIIVSYSTRDLTIQAIDSLFSKCTDLEVILVDNGSKDDTVEALNERFKEQIANQQLVVLDTKTNNGFSKGNNIGASSAKGEYYVFINPDTVAQSDLSQELIAPLKTKYKNKDVILGPRILNPDLTNQHCVNSFPIASPRLFFSHLANKLFKNKKQQKVDWLTGVCFAMKKETFDKCHGWNEAYDLYSEDLDFCYRVKKQLKGQVVILNDVKLVHYGNQSGKQVYQSNFASYEKKMNSLRKFYGIYYNDEKFHKWLKFLFKRNKDQDLKEYLNKYYGG